MNYLLAKVLPWLIVAIVIVIGGSVAGYRLGNHVCEGDHATTENTQLKQIESTISEHQQAADVLTAENVQQRTATVEKDKIITREVIRYVERTKNQPPSFRCALPGAFRLLHDAAATGDPTLAETGSGPADAAEPVETPALIETIAANYEACRTVAARLEGWQRRYHALEANNEQAE